MRLTVVASRCLCATRTVAVAMLLIGLCSPEQIFGWSQQDAAAISH
jgi:hypothetical protein